MTREFLPAALAALLAACGQGPEQTHEQTRAQADEQTPAQAETAAVTVPAGLYVLDDTHASLIWSIQRLGLSKYTARFTGFDASIEFDPVDVERSTVTLTIDPATVRTDHPAAYAGNRPDRPYKSWDEEIGLSPDYLDGRRAPRITFTSTRIERTGPRTAAVTGALDFRGQSRPVSLDATFNGSLENHPYLGGPAIGFSVTGGFRPSDFGVKLWDGILGDEVRVRFEGDFHQRQDAAKIRPATSG